MVFETCRHYALYRVQWMISCGSDLEHILKDNGGGACPPLDGNLSIYWELNSGCLFVNRDSDERVKIKRGQIAVAFYYKDGTAKHGVYSLSELHEEITNPKPVQLTLF